jgi:F420-dependent oxidoreductase-like protein
MNSVIDVSIMIEGQQGLGWPRWQRLGRAVEDLGFSGLFRSDHWVEPEPVPMTDALELWTSLTWLAANTRRIHFGPLVTPISFRDPRVTAWQASGVDALAGGRLRLGLGAGWQQREHEMFGFDLLDLNGRFMRFEEGVEVVARLLSSPEPVSFDGQYYRLKEAQLKPRSPRASGPPITIGGAAKPRMRKLIVAYADEWNTLLGLDEFRQRSAELDEALRVAGRDPKSVRRSMMTTGIIVEREEQLAAKLHGQSVEHLRERNAVIGTVNEAVEQLHRMAEAGLREVMLRWLDMDDITGLELVAAKVLPQLQTS